MEAGAALHVEFGRSTLSFGAPAPFQRELRLS